MENTETIQATRKPRKQKAKEPKTVAEARDMGTSKNQPAVHTQTVMAAELPKVTSVLREFTEARRGQPTKRTPELIDKMILRMMRGDSLLIICQDDDMPGYSTVMRWKLEDKGLWNLFSEAEEDMARAIDEMNELIVRKIITTGDFRRDEMWIAINNQRKRHLNRNRYTDKHQFDVNSTVTVSIPVWATALPSDQVKDGEVIDPDAVYEVETVKRLNGPADTQKPD